MAVEISSPDLAEPKPLIPGFFQIWGMPRLFLSERKGLIASLENPLNASEILVARYSLNKMTLLLQPVGQTPTLQGQEEKNEEKGVFAFADCTAEGEPILFPPCGGDLISRVALTFALSPSPSCARRFPS